MFVIAVCRLGALGLILLLQLWVAWTFLSSQLERAGGGAGETKPKAKTGTVVGLVNQDGYTWGGAGGYT